MGRSAFCNRKSGPRRLCSFCYQNRVVVPQPVDGLLLPAGDVFEEARHAASKRQVDPERRPKKIEICRMGDLGVLPEGLKLNGAVVELVAAFFGIDQDEIHSILWMMQGSLPPKYIVRKIGVTVFRDGDIAGGVNQPMRLDIAIALKKIPLEIGFESPENLDGDRNRVDQLERLSPPFLRCDPKYDLSFVEQLIGVGLYRSGMNGQADESGQKEKAEQIERQEGEPEALLMSKAAV